jgi:hypothetical protein
MQLYVKVDLQSDVLMPTFRKAKFPFISAVHLLVIMRSYIRSRCWLRDSGTILLENV